MFKKPNVRKHMSRHIPFTSILIALCFIIGVVLFLMKFLYAGFPVIPNQNIKSWHIEEKITLIDPAENLKIDLYLPEQTPFYTQVEEHFFPSSFGRHVDKNALQRHVTFSKKKPDAQEIIYYRTVVYDIKSASDSEKNYIRKLEKSYSDYPLSDQFDTEDIRMILDDIHQQIVSRSSDTQSYVTELFSFLKEKDDYLKLIQLKTSINVDKVVLATEILRFAEIPARTMNGMLLSKAKQNAKFLRWVEVFTGQKIIRFTPYREQIGMPSNLFPWYEGYGKPYSITSKYKNIQSEFSVKRHIESALTESLWTGQNIKSFFYKTSVYNLPIEIQLIMSMLLLIPIGAVVCVFLRQVVGIPTYGTFMPVLIAISFRETHLFWGVLFFSAIVIIGMLFRSIFDNMRLLVVPRLTAVLTIVVAIIFVLSFMLHQFGLDAGGLSLFPLIILTMMIERMSITWEEQGAHQAIKLAVTSMMVAILCYLVIGNIYIEHLFVTFPELLFIVLAIALSLGRYTGFKLTEYVRFRAMQT
ncbi:MAG: UUP1 family membrane protein [Pseudomonadota bacterium]